MSKVYAHERIDKYCIGNSVAAEETGRYYRYDETLNDDDAYVNGILSVKDVTMILKAVSICFSRQILRSF